LRKHGDDVIIRLETPAIRPPKRDIVVCNESQYGGRPQGSRSQDSATRTPASIHG
jgi:hypothetical protein